jgi:uncharacterized protein (UPF0276 family)
MKLAINYSPQASALLQAGQIQIDYFKCPDWPDLIEEASRIYPVVVHFTLGAGNRRLPRVDLDQVEILRRKTGTPYVNVHLAPSIEYYPDIPPDTEAPFQVERIVDAMRDDLQLLVDRFGAENVIVENVPYRGLSRKHFLRPCVEPDIFYQLLEDTGCGFLFDIPHARIAAHFLGIDEEEYIHSLPTRRIKEMHITGLQWIDGELEDHLALLQPDWSVLSNILENIRTDRWAAPWMLAFEYGGIGEVFAWRSDPEVIAGQVPRLYEQVNGRTK